MVPQKQGEWQESRGEGEKRRRRSGFESESTGTRKSTAVSVVGDREYWIADIAEE